MPNYQTIHKSNNQYIGPNWNTQFEFCYQNIQLEVNKRLAAFNN